MPGFVAPQQNGARAGFDWRSPTPGVEVAAAYAPSPSRRYPVGARRRRPFSAPRCRARFAVRARRPYASGSHAPCGGSQCAVSSRRRSLRAPVASTGSPDLDLSLPLSIWVIRMTWGKRRPTAAARPTTCSRRASSSEPKSPSSTRATAAGPPFRDHLAKLRSAASKARDVLLSSLMTCSAHRPRRFVAYILP